MAKDNRQKKRIQAAKKAARAAKRGGGTAAPSQVPLRGGYAAPNTSKKAPSRKKKKKSDVPVGKIILTILALLFLAALIVAIVLGIRLAKSFLTGSNQTPTGAVVSNTGNGNVGYYLVGVMGEKDKETGKTGRTEMLSLVYLNKETKVVNIMQIPTRMYLGDDDLFAAKCIGDVWSNPKSLNWCETCRKSVDAKDIKDGKHNVKLNNGKTCNTKITKKTGSSERDLLKVFSELYTINIDNYYLMSQESFVKLVDLAGGINLKLESDMTLGEITYEAGVRKVDGEGALEYALGDWESINGELKNLVHQRQVIAALLEKMMTSDESKLYDNLLALMKGSTPIRTIRNNASSDTEGDTQRMVDLLKELNKIDRSKISFCILPGEEATKEDTVYYSVHKKELADLINKSFSKPGDPPLSAEYLRMKEITTPTEKSDLKTATFDKLLVKQKEN